MLPLGCTGLAGAECTRASIDATNWDAEMSIFKQRIQKPNQLETLRNIEATDGHRQGVHMISDRWVAPHPTPPHPTPPHPTSLRLPAGLRDLTVPAVTVSTHKRLKAKVTTSRAQVLFVGDGLAIVEGLENDAPIGTLDIVCQRCHRVRGLRLSTSWALWVSSACLV